MNYCKKCGGKIEEGTNVCPQCQTLNNNDIQKNTKKYISKKKNNKTNIVIIIILVINIIFSATNTYLIMFSDDKKIVNGSSNNSSTSNNTNNVFTTEVTTPCPEDDNGVHQWERATCIEPSQCLYCKIYKDNKLADHHVWRDYDSGRKCESCGLSYEEWKQDK